MAASVALGAAPEQRVAPATHFQSVAYPRLLERYGQTPLWLSARDERGDVLATWLLFETPSNYLSPPRHAITRRLDKLLMAIHGPHILAEPNLEVLAQIRRAFLTTIRDLAKMGSCVSVMLLLNPDLDEESIAAWKCTAAETGFGAYSTETFIVDLPDSEEALWAQIKSDRRTKIRKAQKVGVKVVCNTDEPSLRHYHDLRRETTRRNGQPDIDWSHVLDTARALEGNGIFNLFLAVAADGTPLAGQVAFAGGRIVTLSGVCVSDSVVREGIPANDLLQWSVLNWAREAKFAAVDFSGAQSASDDPKIKAIDAFKGRWGTRLAYSLRLERHAGRPYRMFAAAARRYLG